MHAQEAVVVRLQKSRNVQSSDPRAWTLLAHVRTSDATERVPEPRVFDEGEIRADDAELLEQGMHVWLCDAHDGVSVKHWGSQTSWSLDSTANIMHLLLLCKHVETQLGEY